jgi:hypothetical protein
LSSIELLFLCAVVASIKIRSSLDPSSHLELYAQLSAFAGFDSFDIMKLSAIIAVVAASVALASPAAVGTLALLEGFRN